MTKADLRKIYLARQRSLPHADRTIKSRQIAPEFFQNFDLTQIKYLHCFIAIEKFNEIDTSLIFQRLWREFPDVTTLVPRVDFKTGEIGHLKFTSETELAPNVWDIQEPLHDESIKTEVIDMVLVPLLCFDKLGNRVGYGKGFYDRFLRKCRSDCAKIGLSYFEPVKEIADADERDVKLDFCITPGEIFRL